MSCCNCAKWQGIRNSCWADCHHVRFSIQRDLYKVKNRRGFNLGPPLDPHDTKYVEDMPKHGSVIPHGVRVEIVVKEDVVYDADGNERRKNVRLPFYQTHRHFECELYAPSP